MTTVKTKYFESVGRRKESVARVRLVNVDINKGDKLPLDSVFTVNGKPFSQYFPKGEFQTLIIEPVERLKLTGLQISAKVRGGGIRGQAEAIRLGLSRALIQYDSNVKSELKVLGFLTRDPRMKERKKYGLKKARRSAQWSIR